MPHAATAPKKTSTVARASKAALIASPGQGAAAYADTALRALRLMHTARAMSLLYEAEKEVCARYVHSTSRGHEAVQLAAAFCLLPQDYAYPYYRDDAMLLGIGMQPSELMAQLMAKADDPFSGGRSYYCHPSLRRAGMPTMPHQSSATGMQAIPATGAAHGLKYKQAMGIGSPAEQSGVVLCSIGDGAITEGEVAEAFHMAALHSLPIVFLVQDNEWAISATKAEIRKGNALDFAKGFPGLHAFGVDGTDFGASLGVLQMAMAHARSGQGPVLVHATCPLLGHHTSGVRKEWYRTEGDIASHAEQDPLPKLIAQLSAQGHSSKALATIEKDATEYVAAQYALAVAMPEPEPETVLAHVLAPTSILAEAGERAPKGSARTFMVDAALHALEELMLEHREALFYGQDVGPQIGGVFREAAGLSQKFGTTRVFNTPIQEAYIVGSTAGMSAVGLRPVVEIQFADYFWPAFNQFVTELSKSCYLSRGQFPISSVIRVPIGAYGGGGPYHSGSIESALLTIKGIKVCYPSNGADLKGLLKAAWHDPNPVVVLEHKGLYWSKVPGTEEAKSIEPSADYIVPIGKARTALAPSAAKVERGESVGVIAYGMGVHWALEAAKSLDGAVEVLDLRSLAPLDYEGCLALVHLHSRLLIITEEPAENSFAESLAGRLGHDCFHQLDAPISVLGALPVPAIPLNRGLEAAVLPSGAKVLAALQALLAY